MKICFLVSRKAGFDYRFRLLLLVAVSSSDRTLPNDWISSVTVDVRPAIENPCDAKPTLSFRETCPLADQNLPFRAVKVALLRKGCSGPGLLWLLAGRISCVVRSVSPCHCPCRPCEIIVCLARLEVFTIRAMKFKSYLLSLIPMRV